MNSLLNNDSFQCCHLQNGITYLKKGVFKLNNCSILHGLFKKCVVHKTATKVFHVITSFITKRKFHNHNI